MLRGNERKNIYLDDEDKQRFLEDIEHKHKDKDFSIYAYCLMDNHAYLLINTKNQDLASIMKSIAVRYATYYNWKHSRVGHVFQDRFKSEPIEDDQYLLAAVRYIHNNPVKAMMVKKPADYKWSSYLDYFRPPQYILLDIGFVLGMIADDRKSALREFERFSLDLDDACFIDYDNETFIRTADEGREYLLNYLRTQGWKIDQIKQDKQLRTEIINHLRTNTRLSQRIIAKLLGVDKSVVEKVRQIKNGQ
ncbi:MAG TPA: transposase [Syntrophomonadaceae bacterium]|nr:transposase [Syntrophomonadaceae bacterium]